jgi:signal transduction histidine kinase
MSRWAWAADALLAAAIAAVAVAEVVSGGSGDTIGVFPVAPKPFPPAVHASPQDWQAVAAAFTGLPLVFRRRFPLSAFWIVVVAALLMRRDAVHAERSATIALGAGLLAAYSAAMYSPHRKSMVASLVAGAGLIGLFHDETLPHVTATYIPFAVLLGVGLTANVVYNSRQRIHALEAEQETTTRLAIERERARIASELHDVVTHNVSVMVIQAGAARKVLDTAPEQARQALLAVEAGGRAAMAELRHAMGLLTGSEPASSEDLSPQPGLDQVPVLADRMRDAGVTVDVHLAGTPVPATSGPRPGRLPSRAGSPDQRGEARGRRHRGGQHRLPGSGNGAHRCRRRRRHPDRSGHRR